LAEKLFPNARGETRLFKTFDSRLIFKPYCYLPNIQADEDLVQLAFTQGAVISLCIMHLSCIPQQLCILSVLYHLTGGKINQLTQGIIARHHPALAYAIQKYVAENDFDAVAPICYLYMFMDVSSPL